MDNPNSNPNNEIHREFLPWFRIYKDGRVERLITAETTVAGTDPLTGVQSKDVTIDPQTGLSAANTAVKLPLLIYIHGGAFCIGSTLWDGFHNHLNADGNVVVLSVENPLPIAYDDTWAAIQWATAHSNQHVQFTRLYFAGGNIVHNMAMRVGSEGLTPGSDLTGIVMVQPFVGHEKINELLEFIFPTMAGAEDPRIYAAKDPNLRRLGCRRVLVMVAEKDYLNESERNYCDTLKKSEWEGTVDLVEAKGEGHVFHILNPEKPTAKILLKQFVSFLNQI